MTKNIDAGIGEWGDTVEYTDASGYHKYMVTATELISLPPSTTYVKVNNEVRFETNVRG